MPQHVARCALVKRALMKERRGAKSVTLYTLYISCTAGHMYKPCAKNHTEKTGEIYDACLDE